MAGNVPPWGHCKLEEGRYKVFPWASTGEGLYFVEIFRYSEVESESFRFNSHKTP